MFFKALSVGMVSLLLPGVLCAAAFKVHPLSLSLNEKKKSTVLKIQNTSDRSVTVQLESMAWSQEGEHGEDVYRPTSDIIFFPKIATIKSGEERLVRLGFRGRNPSREARFYRMFVQELPVQSDGGTLNFIMRFSIPLFVESLPQQKQYALSAEGVEQAQAHVNVRNTGRHHLLVTRLRAKPSRQGESLGETEQGGWYVLPSATRRFSVSLGEHCAQAEQVDVTVEVGQGRRQVSMPVNEAGCQIKK